MDICKSAPWNISDWQGTNLSFQRYLKDVLFPVSGTFIEANLQTAEVLTTEGAFMMMLILVLVILTLMGSLISAYEFFCEEKTDSENSRFKIKKKVISNHSEALHWKINSTVKVWLEDIRSFLKCFCLVKNGKKILEADSSKEQFNFLQGIRVIASFGIIIYHTVFFYGMTLRNLESLKPCMESLVAHIFLNFIFLIDVFFVLSGFLNAYSFSKDYVKNKGKISISYFYIKRIVRVAPVYMMVLGFYTLLLPYTCSGSKTVGYTIHPVCQKSWWWNLLFINNFQPSVQQCMVWCWYQATEMQFYILSPIFMISLLRRPAFGYCFTSICIFLSCFASFFTTKHCNLLDGFTRILSHTDNLAPILYRVSLYYEKVYIMPHTRIHSYLVGILLGIYIYKRRNAGKDIKCNWVQLCCGWIVSVVLMSVAVFALYNRKESAIEVALYNGTKHLLFSAGIAWLIFVCVNGQGGFINRFLSYKIYFPFSKLSYCAYLIHYVILMRFYKIAPKLQEFSVSSLINLCLHMYFWTFVFAFIASLLVEIPIGNLLDYFRNKNTLRKKIL